MAGVRFFATGGIGGVILATWGAGWAFALNGVSYLAVLAALAMLDTRKLYGRRSVARGVDPGGLELARQRGSRRLGGDLGLGPRFVNESVEGAVILADARGGGFDGRLAPLPGPQQRMLRRRPWLALIHGQPPRLNTHASLPPPEPCLYPYKPGSEAEGFLFCRDCSNGTRSREQRSAGAPAAVDQSHA